MAVDYSIYKIQKVKCYFFIVFQSDMLGIGGTTNDVDVTPAPAHVSAQNCIYILTVSYRRVIYRTVLH